MTTIPNIEELMGQTLLDMIKDARKDLKDDKLFREVVNESLIFLKMKDTILANHMSISTTTVARWKNGNAIPHPAMRKPVYDFLERSVKLYMNGWMTGTIQELLKLSDEEMEMVENKSNEEY